MIAPNHYLKCEKAELYYYDFLFEESRGLIPKSIVNHINQCHNCQEHINQLKEAIWYKEKAKPHQNQGTSAAMAEMLKLHFTFIGKEITCNIVRPFLPGMLNPALEVRIPTPITAHLDNCRQCSEDLDKIRDLGLNHRQLCRLSQLFTDKADQNNVNCLEAQTAIFAVVLMHFEKTNKEVLKHLCTCHNCRSILYQSRNDFRNELSIRGTQETFPCEHILPADIFDYVVPYGLDPAKDKYAKFRESLTSHMRTCPICLAKMQQLHNTIYGILERAESEVVTIYDIDRSAKTHAAGESDDLYRGFPIKVKVINHEDKAVPQQSVENIDSGDALKHEVSRKKLEPLLKTVLTTAALILVGFALLLNVPLAKGVTIEGIYKAIEKVKNVHIASFAPNGMKPIQEIWMSRESNIYMNKTKQELVLWDISNRMRKTKHLGTALINVTELTNDSTSAVKRRMNGCLGLMPFYDISEMPTDAKWNLVEDSAIKVVKGVEVYDLEWTEEVYDEVVVFKKWRFFVDFKTSLPQRIEILRKTTIDSEYDLISMMVVDYLSDSKVQEIIRKSSF
jgi:hypothetical protein